MLAYVLRRLAATIPVMLIVAVLVFLMLRLTPSDPAAIIAGDNANSEQVAEIRKLEDQVKDCGPKLKTERIS